MTTKTEQSFKKFFIKSLHVDNLHAESHKWRCSFGGCADISRQRDQRYVPTLTLSGWVTASNVFSGKRN